MTRPSSVSGSDAMKWADALVANRPSQPTPETAVAAIEIRSFNAAAAVDGVYLRLATAAGQEVDLYLNAAVATQLIDVLSQMGTAAGWRNADDGSLIVRDPESLAHSGPKS